MNTEESFSNWIYADQTHMAERKLGRLRWPPKRGRRSPSRQPAGAEREAQRVIATI